MKALKWLLIVIATIVAMVVGIGLTLPDEAHVERSITIEAQPSTVYTVLNGFRRFNEWSPWANLDPNAKYTLEGPPMGVGAKSSWSSEDPSVGAGSQEIVSNDRDREVKVRLEFAGFDSDNFATYTLTPSDDGTEVVWAYDTHAKGHLLSRYFGLMLDDMLGPDIEKGLAQLKKLVEGLPDADFSDLQVELVQTEPEAGRPYAGYALSAVHPGPYAAIESTYDKLIAYKTVAGLEDNGDPWERYLTDPGSTPEAEQVTHIFLPVK